MSIGGIEALIASFASLAEAIEMQRMQDSSGSTSRPDDEYCDAGEGFVMRRRVPAVEYGNEVDGFRMRRRKG